MLRKALRFCLALEGGYDNWALAASVREVLQVLTFKGRLGRIPTVRTARGAAVIEKARQIHARFNVWTA